MSANFRHQVNSLQCSLCLSIIKELNDSETKKFKQKTEQNVKKRIKI